MECTILKISDNSSVIVKCNSGEFFGVWMSLDLPVLFHKYILEIGISEVVQPDSIVILEKPIESIDYNEKFVSFSGYVEDIEDGVLFFRVCDDIIMFELADTDKLNYSIYNKRYISISVAKVELYDIFSK